MDWILIFLRPIAKNKKVNEENDEKKKKAIYY
jgi:hypothetical protein